MSTYRVYLFPFTSKVGPNENMAPPSRAKGGAMAPVPPPPCGRQCWPLGGFGPAAQRRIRGFKATGETMHVPEVSWELGSKVPPTKN